MLQNPKLKELSFLVYGLGLSGCSVVKFFKKNRINNFQVWDDKEKKLYKPGLILLLILISQVVLGIFTLLSDLHIAIASFHQITGVLLVLASLNLYYSAIK